MSALLGSSSSSLLLGDDDEGANSPVVGRVIGWAGMRSVLSWWAERQDEEWRERIRVSFEFASSIVRRVMAR